LDTSGTQNATTEPDITLTQTARAGFHLAFYVAADNLERRQYNLSKLTNVASLRLLFLETSILQRE